MKETGIQSIIVKKFRPTPSKEKVEERENIINRDFSTTGINQKWDLGSQYTSDSFAEKIQEYKMTHSFSYKGNPYDNACIESFHAILKKEEVNHVQYLDFNSARVELFKYIEGWYNCKRIHGSFGYLTPQEMEDLALNPAV